MDGFPSASNETVLKISLASTDGDRRNFLRTGTLKKSALTSMVVPWERTAGVQEKSFPPSTITIVPFVGVEGRSFLLSSGAGHVSRLNFEIEAMEGIASPRNPIVIRAWMSSTSRSFDVACRSKQRRASSLFMPQPLSLMRIICLPPPWISMPISVEPASREFSTNSLTTEAGFSMTSPAAIWLMVCSLRTRIFDAIVSEAVKK